MLFKPFGLEYRKDTFVWRNTYISVPLLTQCPSLLPQGELEEKLEARAKNYPLPPPDPQATALPSPLTRA